MLTLHSLAMACVVGVNLVVALRLLGVAPAATLSRFAAFYRLHWFGAAAVIFSGLALVLAYPAKALTNPVFFLKLACISSGLLVARHLQLRIQSADFEQAAAPIKLLAAWSLLLWAGSITAGRFLAYTHSILLASSYY